MPDHMKGADRRCFWLGTIQWELSTLSNAAAISVISFIYPTTCSPKGRNSSSAATEAAPVLLLQIYLFPIPDEASTIVYLLLPSAAEDERRSKETQKKDKAKTKGKVHSKAGPGPPRSLSSSPPPPAPGAPRESCAQPSCPARRPAPHPWLAHR